MSTNTRLPTLASRFGLATGLAVAMLASPGILGTAEAAPACGKHADIVDKLADAYKEFRSSVMVDSQGNLVEVYSNLDTGTWTLLVTRPRGRTCVVSSGENFINTVSDRVVGEPA